MTSSPATRIAGRRQRSLVEVDWNWRLSYPAELKCDGTGLTMLSKTGWPSINGRRLVRWDEVTRITLRKSAMGRYINVYGKRRRTLRMRVGNLQGAADSLRASAPAAVSVELQQDRSRRVRIAETVTLIVLVTFIVALVVVAIVASPHR